jgi:hypothetical protein
MTVNAAVALLLPLLGSVAALLMVALLLTTLPFGALGSTLATTVMVAERALAIEPIVQVNGCSGFPGMPQVHDPTLGVTASTLTSAGRVSFTTTLLAEDGPALLTAMVYVTLVPATTGLGGVTVLLIARSAEAKKLTLPVAELLPLTGSGVVLLTVAVSLISAGSLLVKATWIVVPPPATTV